jgi:hypothetical protein
MSTGLKLPDRSDTLSAIALKILTGETSIVEGLRALRCLVANDEKIAASEPLMLLRFIDSELDAFPPVEKRNLYSCEYLAVLDAELVAYLTRVQNDVFSACQMILEDTTGPDSNAEGLHSTFRRDASGMIFMYETWNENGMSVQRTDNIRKIDDGVGSPHCHLFSVPSLNWEKETPRGEELGVRAATVDEIPRCEMISVPREVSRLEFGFHDCLVSGFRWHDGKNIFVFHLQYITRWIPPTGGAVNFRFEIADAELTFQNVSETMLSFDWGLSPLTARIDRVTTVKSRTAASGVVEHHYRIEFTQPRAFVTLWSSGHVVKLLHEPVLCDRQHLPTRDE